jgi:hypothetical protein
MNSNITRLRARQGATFGYSGTITLPGTPTWTPSLVLPFGQTSYTMATATLTFLQINAQNSAMKDYTLTLAAPATDTASWPNKCVRTSLELTSNDTPPNVVVSDDFEIDIAAASP